VGKLLERFIGRSVGGLYGGGFMGPIRVSMRCAGRDAYRDTAGVTVFCDCGSLPGICMLAWGSEGYLSWATLGWDPPGFVLCAFGTPPGRRVFYFVILGPRRAAGFVHGDFGTPIRCL
jgi:hypothetical protein